MLCVSSSADEQFSQQSWQRHIPNPMSDPSAPHHLTQDSDGTEHEHGT